MSNSLDLDSTLHSLVVLPCYRTKRSMFFSSELILLQYFSASMILILCMPVRRGSVNVAMLSVDMLQESAQMPA
ncbi:hypothetical protein Mapa_012416 [Marchantia paleacea]|nr:hypothetical protein Mapa_012416 [Marchantia paleacea]